MATIIRDPEKFELRDFIPLQTPTGRIMTPQDKFAARIGQEMLKATKAGLPFADVAVRADANDLVENYIKEWKRTGYKEKEWNPKVDWEKYSDLTNFEVLDEGEIHDKEASKMHRLPVFVKFSKYKYKGFSNTYTVMEAIEEASQRALQKLENRNLGKPSPVDALVLGVNPTLAPTVTPVKKKGK